jgi:hypothetical protein
VYTTESPVSPSIENIFEKGGFSAHNTPYAKSRIPSPAPKINSKNSSGTLDGQLLTAEQKLKNQILGIKSLHGPDTEFLPRPHEGMNLKLDWLTLTSPNPDFLQSFAPVLAKEWSQTIEGFSEEDIIEHFNALVSLEIADNLRKQLFKGVNLRKDPYGTHILNLTGTFWNTINPARHCQFLLDLQKAFTDLRERFPVPKKPTNLQLMNGAVEPEFHDVRVYVTRIDGASDVFVDKYEHIQLYTDCLHNSKNPGRVRDKNGKVSLFRYKSNKENPSEDEVSFSAFPPLKYQHVIGEAPKNSKDPSAGTYQNGEMFTFGSRRCDNYFRIYDKTLELMEKYKRCKQPPADVAEILASGKSLWRFELECKRRFELVYLYFRNIDQIFLKLCKHTAIFFPFVKNDDNKRGVRITSHYAK